MKTFLSLWALLLLCAVGASSAQSTNLPFAWESGTVQPVGTANGWKFYEKVGANRVLLGGTTGETNRYFVVSNFTLGSTRTFVVTATNLAGEGPESIPYVSPLPPTQATNLHPITASIETAVPGVIEISQDLQDWSQRLRLSQAAGSKVLVAWVQYPNEPLLFMRSKSVAARISTTPPIP